LYSPTGVEGGEDDEDGEDDDDAMARALRPLIES
jgi:hypothetical protein